MNQPVSATLEIRKTAEGETICCSSCGHSLARSGQSWKASSVVTELPTGAVGGKADRGTSATVLRLFVCRGCGALLDSETALQGEPFLEDIVNKESR